MKAKKLITLVAMIGVMTVGIVGCGNSDSGAETTNAEATTSEKEDKEAEWDASNEISIVSREDGSGTRGAFIELFGVEEKVDGEKMDMTTEEAQITNSTSVMLTTVAGDPYAIGYASLGSLDKSVKALEIDGAKATVDSIKAGEYQVARPFNIVTKETIENEVAQDFVNFILSVEGQKVVEENGFIPVDGAKAFAGNHPSGNAVVGGSSSVSAVMQKLIEAYMKMNPNAEIELQTTDSTTGVTSTLEGSYDIGMASRELKESELSKGAKGIVMATDGIAVITNLHNPVSGLTSEQVKEIYTGATLSWDELSE